MELYHDDKFLSKGGHSLHEKIEMDENYKFMILRLSILTNNSSFFNNV